MALVFSAWSVALNKKQFLRISFRLLHKWVSVDEEFLLRNEVAWICGIEKASVSRGKIFFVNLFCPCKRNLCLLNAAGVGVRIVGGRVNVLSFRRSDKCSMSRFAAHDVIL